MKNYRKLIEGALTDLDDRDTIDDGADAVEPEDNPEDFATHPDVQPYIMAGYQIRAVSIDEDGKRVVMLVKGNPDTGDSIKYVPIDEDPDPSQEVVESFSSYRDVNKMVIAKAKLADSWIRIVMKPYHQISLKKKFIEREPLAPEIKYMRWELNWNGKPFAIVLSRINDFLDDALDINGELIPSELQVAVTVGVHGKSMLPHVSSKLYGPLKKMNSAHQGRGILDYNEFRDAIEHLMDFLPTSEIPEEYR